MQSASYPSAFLNTITRKMQSSSLPNFHSEILQRLQPDFVHILINGRIVKTGDASLIKEIETYGYDSFKAQVK